MTETKNFLAYFVVLFHKIFSQKLTIHWDFKIIFNNDLNFEIVEKFVENV